MARKYFYYSKRNIVKSSWLCSIQPSTTTTIIRCDRQSRTLMHQLLFNGIPLRSRHQRRNSWYICFFKSYSFLCLFSLSSIITFRRLNVIRIQQLPFWNRKQSENVQNVSKLFSEKSNSLLHFLLLIDSMMVMFSYTNS